MRRTALIPLLLLSTVALVAARDVPSARPAPRGAQPSAPQLAVEPLAVQPGDVVTLHGRGFPHNVHVALFAVPPHADSIRIGGAVTGRSGRFEATVHIRAHSDPGALTALACYDSCRVKASARFRIVAR